MEVTAETLYEAIATALAALQQDNWVGEIGQGFTTAGGPLKPGFGLSGAVQSWTEKREP